MNIQQLRKDTPGCEHVLHFNNAGAALPPQQVTSAIKNHLDLESLQGGYEAANMASATTDRFYQSAATLINCTPKEIAFIDNATRAWDMAFYSLSFNKGDKILTAHSEYASNYLALLHRARQLGLTIEVVANDASGQIDLVDLTNKMTKEVKLIAITHVPSQGGLVNPAQAVGEIARQHGVTYLLDATQSIGQMPVDVQAIGCDFLCATGRKFLRGPRGTGFLYARQSIIKDCNPPFIDLHSATWVEDNSYVLQASAQRFETWEQNIAAKIGLTVAIEYALTQGMTQIWARIQKLATSLRQQLAEIPGITIRDLGQEQCGIVTFNADNKSTAEIQQYLRTKHINVSLSLPEYARLDLVKRQISSLVRASVHYYNTEEEVETFCQAIKTCICEL